MQIQDRFKGHGYSETNFQLLYSLYSFPNVILPFFGGVLVDRYGCRRTLLWFSVILVAGQALVAFGVSISSFWVMLLGRLLYSLGGESITVAQSAFLTEWFKGSELALSFGSLLKRASGNDPTLTDFGCHESECSSST